MKTTLTLYGHKISGHAHRVQALLEMLNLPYDYVEVRLEDLKQPDYLAINPLGQIPALRDGDAIIVDSAAIMIYLVEKYAPDSQWLPRDPIERAEQQRWLSIAAGELRFGPALARVIALFKSPQSPEPARVIAHKIFSFMDAHLNGRAFLAASSPTLADLACYAYTARAPEGGVSLESYPNIRAWVARMEALPRFTPMMKTGEAL